MDKNKTMKKKGSIFNFIKGFTLIEVIIMVVVVSVLSGLGLAYYNSFSEQKKLEEAKDQFVVVLNLARQKAIAADKTPSPTCADFKNYNIYFPAISSYGLRFYCDTTYLTVQNYSLPSGIQFTSVHSTITFSKLTGYTTATNVIIKNTSLSECYQIDISTMGVINSTKLSVCP